MEKWQILYLGIIGIGFLIGWFFSPKIAVLFVWICIIIVEILDNRKSGGLSL